MDGYRDGGRRDVAKPVRGRYHDGVGPRRQRLGVDHTTAADHCRRIQLGADRSDIIRIAAAVGERDELAHVKGTRIAGRCQRVTGHRSGSVEPHRTRERHRVARCVGDKGGDRIQAVPTAQGQRSRARVSLCWPIGRATVGREGDLVDAAPRVREAEGQRHGWVGGGGDAVEHGAGDRERARGGHGVLDQRWREGADVALGVRRGHVQVDRPIVHRAEFEVRVPLAARVLLLAATERVNAVGQAVADHRTDLRIDVQVGAEHGAGIQVLRRHSGDGEVGSDRVLDHCRVDDRAVADRVGQAHGRREVALLEPADVQVLDHAAADRHHVLSGIHVESIADREIDGGVGRPGDGQL